MSGEFDVKHAREWMPDNVDAARVSGFVNPTRLAEYYCWFGCPEGCLAAPCLDESEHEIWLTAYEVTKAVEESA